MTSSKFASHYSGAGLPHKVEGGGDAAEDNSDGGLVLVSFFRDASQPLGIVLDYLSREIALQSTGSFHGASADAEQTGTAGAGAWANGLLSAEWSDLTRDAERRFLTQSASALSRGCSVMLVCDGLEEEQGMVLAELVVHVQRIIAAQANQLGANGSASHASIQCIMSVTRLPGPFGGQVQGGAGADVMVGPAKGKEGVRGEAREVELEDLYVNERIRLALGVFQEMGISSDSVGEEEKESSPNALAAVIAEKREANLPLYVVAAAAQVAQYAATHVRHRLVDSSGQVPRGRAVAEFGEKLPQSLSELWSGLVLPELEQRVDYLTVQWVILHLLSHPQGLPRQQLQAMVRATLDRVHQRSAQIQDPRRGPPGVQRLMLVGPAQDPALILDADALQVVWDKRAGKPLKQAASVLKSVGPYTGRIWCTDNELHVILSHLRPFLRATCGGVWRGVGEWQLSGGILSSEWEEVLALDHEALRVEAVCRYDNPGSVSLEPFAQAETGAGAGAGAGAGGAEVGSEKQMLVTHMDAHSVHGYSSCQNVRLVHEVAKAGGPQLQRRYITSPFKVNARVTEAIKLDSQVHCSRRYLFVYTCRLHDSLEKYPWVS